MNSLPNIKLIELYTMLINANTSSNLFNPYFDNCLVHDSSNAIHIRRKNLLLYLDAQYKSKPRDLWIAEAAGYKGARRTGIPLVPENLLDYCSDKLETSQPFKKATKTKTVKIRTANYLWEEISAFHHVPFLWNAVLFHPHKEGNQFSNRKPSKNEIAFFKDIFNLLEDAFQFLRVFCIGRVAQKFITSFGVEGIYIRHPSMGGINEFRRAIRSYQL